jgi:hypothetical protein
MGLTLSQISDGFIDVIAKIDGAIIKDDSAYENGFDETYADYLKDLDESKLKFVDGDEPTRFVMRKVLPYKMAQKVQNKQLRFEKGEAQFQMSFMAEEVRCALCDVKNPDNIPEDQKIKFSKHNEDNGASDDFIAKLIAAGIVSDLFVARQNVMQNKGKADLKKS